MIIRDSLGRISCITSEKMDISVSFYYGLVDSVSLVMNIGFCEVHNTSTILETLNPQDIANDWIELTERAIQSMTFMC